MRVLENQRVLIRPARLGDADQVWPLVHDFGPSFAPERREFETTWRTLSETADTLVAVAEVTGHQIVGYVLANSRLTFVANGPVAWVEEVMVAKSHRRFGVGRELMEHAENWAAERGASYLALASRRAGPFYLRLGYEDAAVFYKKPLV
ncbi:MULTISPECIES: GNAT family N-acetyltransferase [Brachybacterium]|uniref:GNAT family N-acetyltransferase n=1 Tax=Brachybacterium tyrofermentans TaxID=47848 RepID=A0ABW0FIG1_9MICO